MTKVAGLTERTVRASIHASTYTSFASHAKEVWDVVKFPAFFIIFIVLAAKTVLYQELLSGICLWVILVMLALSLIIHIRGGKDVAKGMSEFTIGLTMISSLSLPVYADTRWKHWIDPTTGETTLPNQGVAKRDFLFWLKGPTDSMLSIDNEYTVDHKFEAWSSDAERLQCHLQLQGVLLNTELTNLDGKLLGLATWTNPNEYIHSVLENSILAGTGRTLSGLTKADILANQADILPRQIWEENKSVLQQIELTSDDDTSFTLSCS